MFTGNIHSNVANIDGRYVVLDGSNSNYNNNTGSTSSSNNNSSYKPKYVEKTLSCSACKGTGTSLTRSSVPLLGSGAANKAYCEVCDNYGLIHYHKPCEVCKGKGVVNRMVSNK